MTVVRVAVVGATGYTGLELLRLAAGHPEIRVTVATSRREAGKTLSEYWGFSPLPYEVRITSPDPDHLAAEAEVAFLCVPHGTAQEMAAELLSRGIKVIDLSADFRIPDPEVYQRWYETPHRFPGLLSEAVYGLSEIHREEIRRARLVANPGCYPTAALLPLVPLVREGLVEPRDILIDAKSGVSGAGRKAEVSLSFCEVNEDFRAYRVAAHRHTPEMEAELTRAAGSEVRVLFTPHLTPMQRGIFATIYAYPRTGEGEIHEALRDFYAESPFVEVLPPGRVPRVAEVRGTNLCRIGLRLDHRTGRLVLLSVIDNLVKGASGQALQNLNLVQGWPEDLGLPRAPVFP
ncbi:N-acetyl-gamma-glutamyl-phosphate reductase [Thermosulfurimonas sp. F29]|uniref:N-acetyl-gamma-glutamyl-phosphate reductase n=1 Tax=Thermosulfurimonas sp. F29 TaxID=2867247 RepID=UPI00210515CA|nr:N-acetyl-gamma-glutamyl-phosphate reductase [Thermosulfurimonas sp. F29]